VTASKLTISAISSTYLSRAQGLGSAHRARVYCARLMD